LSFGIAQFVVLLILLLAVFQLTRTNLGAWTTLATCLLGTALLATSRVSSHRVMRTLILATMVGVSAIDYLAWRTGVINWASWWIAVPLFLAEAFGVLHTLGFQYTLWPRPELALTPREDPTWRPVFVFIPTINEGVEILEPTLRGVLAARDAYLFAYPHARVTVVVCNDGRAANAPGWREVERLARKVDVLCITRKESGGAKAGNIENARQLCGATDDALIAIFDADQIPEQDFLLNTVLPFADPSIGWVQTGQYYRNTDNPIARWANDQQSLFYQVICPGKSSQNAVFICGTNVVIRAAALDEIGGLPQDSLTEDFAASIRLHPRWRSVFIPGILATGLGPMTLQEYFKQQRRWAIGTLSVFRNHWREIFLPGPRGRGMRFGQRIQYALACTHYFCGLRDLIYIIAPLVYLIFGIPAVRGATLSLFFWHFLPYWVASQVAFWYAAWGKSSIRGILLGFGSFPVLIYSAITAITGREVGFAVTSKQRDEARAARTWKHLIPHGVAFMACLVALWVFTRNHNHDEQAALLVSAFWVLYSMVLLSGIFCLGVADWLGLRARNWYALSVVGRLAKPSLRFAVPPLLGLAVLMTGALFVRDHSINSVSGATVPNYFVPDQKAGQPYLGVVLPVELLNSQQPKLERKLGVSFAIVGRTQEISDEFDRGWVDRLATRGARPWITLLFTVPGGAAYDTSLPAIANGVHDDALRRWAGQIRNYGKQVYLAILPHVDRNWVPSSAVTNGGIPQDVERAWKHVREIFRQEKALNVAWVWSPADPIHDSEYAPPRTLIDIVLLSLISYPGTEWADPAKSLAALTARYPNMPLFVEVSAAGEPAQKAGWLRNVKAALATAPSIHAVLYHEGSPMPKAKLADHAAWSLASDSQSLEAMRHIAQAARTRPLDEQ
jgi:cellulose synthase (UDP-forming)